MKRNLHKELVIKRESKFKSQDEHTCIVYARASYKIKYNNQIQLSTMLVSLGIKN